MACIAEFAAPEKKVLGMMGFAFTTLFSAVVCMNRFAQLTIIRHSLLLLNTAALLAAAEILQRVFEETGDLQSASMNNRYLNQYGVHAIVTGITVDAGEDTVLVQVSANPDRLFPSLAHNVIVSDNGFAKIRVFTR